MSDNETKKVETKDSPNQTNDVKEEKSERNGRDKHDDRDKSEESRDDRGSHKKSRDSSRSRSRSRSRSKSRSRSRSRRRGSNRSRDRRGRSRDTEEDKRKAREYGDDCYGRKLYIGNLDFRTDQGYLRDKFGKYGELTDVFVPRDDRGDSRGFAFITYAEKRDAEDAVDGMHDSKLDGRRITCNVAKPRPPQRGGDRRGSRGGRGGRSPRRDRPSRKIYVGNLPIDVRESEIEDMYKKFGKIVRIDLKTPSRPPAYAFVEFDDERDAEDALRDTNNTKFGGEYLRVEFSR